jgi:hypothetical protein
MAKKKIVIVSILAVIMIAAVAVMWVVIGASDNKKQEPTVAVSLVEGNYYAENKLETVNIELSEESTEGTLVWVQENQLLELGEHEYEWKFIPKDASKYLEKTGKIVVNALYQYVVSISVKNQPTKVSGYQAYDTLDTTGLVIETTYDTGSVNEITSGYEIVYGADNNLSSMRTGDTSVTVKFREQVATIGIDEVEICKVETPEILGTYTYNGNEQTANVEESVLYTKRDDTATNAGEHDVYFSLTDTNNCVWKETNSVEDLSVKFVILKAEQNVTEQNYVGNYDGDGHSATAVSAGASSIYYSTEPLTKDNYSEGNTIAIRVSEITSGTTIYYYAVGNDNFNDKAGSLSIVINKAVADVELENAFIYQSQNVAALDEDFVTVFGVNSVQVEFSGKISFTYYTSYESDSVNQKTTPANSGSAGQGTAPKNAGTYYVVATFAGNETYAKSSSEVATLVVGNEPDGFYAKNSEDEFEWIVSGLGHATFSAKEISTSVKVFSVESTLFGNGYISVEDGEYVLNSSNGKTYIVEISAEKDSVTVTEIGNDSNVITLSKFENPEFAGTYTRNTANDEANPSVLTIYTENGTIRFTFKYVYVDGGTTKEATRTGTVSVGDTTDEGISLAINVVSSSSQTSYGVDYDIANKTMYIENFAPSSVNGIYTKVQ